MASGGKRGPEDDELALVAAKKAKTEIVAAQNGAGNGQLAVARRGIPRTSSLEAPIMLLAGHAGAVFTGKFSPDGENFASGSHDKEIFLWRVRGDCDNYLVLRGHKNAVLELHWMPEGNKVVTCSADQTLRLWDTETGKQVKKMLEHSSFVNGCCPAPKGPPLVASASDDGTAKLWDMRQRGSVQTFPDKYQVTAVAFSAAGDKVFSGGIDNEVKVWDLRRPECASLHLLGHTDTVTGMALAPDGNFLLTNSMDCTLRVWDVRPYAPANRCTKIFTGHQHNFEKNLLRCAWSPDGLRVTAGSGDRMVYIWDVDSRRILYKLPGHKGSVNEAVFHPKEPIIASCSTDKTIYLGEFDPMFR